jgi:hypothetical protein
MQHKDVNPLDILDKRRCAFRIPYFVSTTIAAGNPFLDYAELEHWILTNTRGRFYIVSRFDKTRELGFEQGKELTYTLFACPVLRG